MRLHGLDIARFLAFCGMVLVNFRIAAQVDPDGSLVSSLTNALEGRASALFVVLAGIGLSIGQASRGVLFARAMVLFALGVLNLTIFEADILHFYALYFLLALPFLSAPPPALLWAALGAVTVGFLSLILLDYEANWDWQTFTYAEFWTLEGFLRHSFFNGWHPVFPWVGFVLLGMWIGRLDLHRNAIQIRLILGGLTAALIGALPRYLLQGSELAEVFGTASIPPGPFYMLAASGTAALVIGLMLRIGDQLDQLGIAEWLAAPGRMALSLYVIHILLGMGILEAMGQLDGSLTPQEIFGFSLGFCAFSMMLTWFWNLLAKRGPLEELMRRTSDLFR